MLCQGLMVGALVVVAGQAQAFEKLIEVDTAGCNTNVAINNAIGQSFKLSASTALDSVDIWVKPNLYYTTSYRVACTTARARAVR
ncbi:hypothetical protein HV824_05295 [Myxococcus sp. AM009]|uniref:hypothetical protein n=1 Tax=Myxococcus sp. AM009 TaxID=2745137 RepID=UPI0015950438|nr:hypothetical protein [Myxococcus sp. AM009]NVI97533.1 hypothetical protein [Myxococcus sp. AM009]